MFKRLAQQFILICVLLHAVQTPLGFADPSLENAETVTVDNHEITQADVLLAGVAGQIVIDRLLYGKLRAYFIVSESGFQKATSKLMLKSAERVLYISSFKTDDTYYRVSKARSRKQYGKHPNATFLEVSSPEDLISKLKALPQNSSFDRIELDIHGSAGALEFADGTLMTRHDHPAYSKGRVFDVEELSRAGLNIAAAGADLRITACRVADDWQSGRPIGKDFMSALGKSLMPKGGRVFASEKSIVYLPIETQIGLKLPLLGLLGQAIRLANEVVTTKKPKDNRHRKDVVQVDISPRETKSCAPIVIWSLQNILKGK
jgi:hypothetical protein